jgi:peptide/nickel transport system permease protein
MISDRLFNTFFLAGVTAIVSIPFALILGLFAALYRESWFDRIVNITTLTTISAPEFFIAYVLVLLLAVRFPPDIVAFLPLPSLANVSPDTPLLERLWRISLPVLTLTLVITAYMMRMTRTAIVSILSEPYIEMARLKGASRRRIVFQHALPNAWAPIANVIAFILAYLVVGVVVVEVVFVYPGIGQLMVDSVRTRDIPVVQASSLIFAGTFILLNLIARRRGDHHPIPK